MFRNSLITKDMHRFILSWARLITTTDCNGLNISTNNDLVMTQKRCDKEGVRFLIQPTSTWSLMGLMASPVITLARDCNGFSEIFCLFGWWKKLNTTQLYSIRLEADSFELVECVVKQPHRSDQDYPPIVPIQNTNDSISQAQDIHNCQHWKTGNVSKQTTNLHPTYQTILWPSSSILTLGCVESLYALVMTWVPGLWTSTSVTVWSPSTPRVISHQWRHSWSTVEAPESTSGNLSRLAISSIYALRLDFFGDGTFGRCARGLYVRKISKNNLQSRWHFLSHHSCHHGSCNMPWRYLWHSCLLGNRCNHHRWTAFSL